MYQPDHTPKVGNQGTQEREGSSFLLDYIQGVIKALGYFLLLETRYTSDSYFYLMKNVCWKETHFPRRF